MFKSKYFFWIIICALCSPIISCKVPAIQTQNTTLKMPEYVGTDSLDSISWGTISWKTFFQDKYLADLIDTALVNNKELKITLQDIEIAKNDINFKRSKIYPQVGLKVGTGVEKVGRYTSQGAGDASTEITAGKEMPDPLPDFGIAATANWEVDIWHKLKNAEVAAQNHYFATVEGKNFVLTNLIAEVANTYYELVMLDNQLKIVQDNRELQKRALEVVKAQKEVGKVNELAVQKFTVELLKTEGIAYKIQQDIVETENELNFLLGRFPQKIKRNSESLMGNFPATIHTGFSSSLLHNRPDIKEAELELKAANLDVKVARAEFFPSLDISAALGLQAFKPSYLVKLPESMLYSLAGDLFAPLLNKGAIKAEFNTANARQIQVLYDYEQKVLNAYMEVSNQMANIDNIDQELSKQQKQVDILNNSIDISKDLFLNNRAEYLEVLTTQKDVLESKLDLYELKKNKYTAMVQLYKALGGGWK